MNKNNYKIAVIFIFALTICPLSFAKQDGQTEKKPTIKSCQYIEIYTKCPYQKDPECVKWLGTQKTKYCENPELLEKHIVSEFSKWDEKLQTLSFDFTQTIIYTDADLTHEVEGKIYYKKPSMLRIEHIKPQKQIIWTDKKDIYIYQPETTARPAQAIKSKWQTWLNHTGTSYFGIIDFGHYRKTITNHDIEQIEFMPHTVSLSMTPKMDSDIYTLTLILEKTDLFPGSVKFKTADIMSDIVINTLKINKTLPEDIMKIDTEGVKIEEM